MNDGDTTYTQPSGANVISTTNKNALAEFIDKRGRRWAIHSHIYGSDEPMIGVYAANENEAARAYTHYRSNKNAIVGMAAPDGMDDATHLNMARVKAQRELDDVMARIRDAAITAVTIERRRKGTVAKAFGVALTTLDAWLKADAGDHR
jgi:hypothetical protein